MMFDYKQTELAPGIRICDYEEWLENKDHNNLQIIELIKLRFINRYINPISEFDCSGAFTAMAICCLMIEMFMSHRYKEYIETNGKSKPIFKQFLMIMELILIIFKERIFSIISAVGFSIKEKQEMGGIYNYLERN